MPYARILAIDPGPTQSAIVVWDGVEIHCHDILTNDELLRWIRWKDGMPIPVTEATHLAIEEVTSYGMPVGKDVFQTVFWSGRFYEAGAGLGQILIPRHNVKMHICNSTRAKDSNIRQALIDRFGKPGTKKERGLTYGLKRDEWQAFALAVTALAMLKLEGGGG